MALDVETKAAFNVLQGLHTHTHMCVMCLPTHTLNPCHGGKQLEHSIHAHPCTLPLACPLDRGHGIHGALSRRSGVAIADCLPSSVLDSSGGRGQQIASSDNGRQTVAELRADRGNPDGSEVGWGISLLSFQHQRHQVARP